MKKWKIDRIISVATLAASLIAIVLVFVGLKMLAEIADVYVPVYISLLVILGCITGSIGYSMMTSRRKGV